MTNETQTQNDQDSQDSQETTKTELQVLKGRADVMGITYSNNIGVDALKKKIADAQEGKVNEGDNETQEKAQPQTQTVSAMRDPNPLAGETGDEEAEPDLSKMTKAERNSYIRQRVSKEAMKLIRIRVACLDPKKKEIPGEFFTTGNKYIGTVRKYVPFGEATDDGYHVPYCIYQMMKSRKFLQISTRRDRATGRMNTTTRYVPEFSIEVLPQLTEAELNRLAIEQQASGRLSNEDLGVL